MDWNDVVFAPSSFFSLDLVWTSVCSEAPSSASAPAWTELPLSPNHAPPSLATTLQRWATLTPPPQTANHLPAPPSLWCAPYSTEREKERTASNCDRTLFCRSTCNQTLNHRVSPPFALTNRDLRQTPLCGSGCNHLFDVAVEIYNKGCKFR